MLKFSTIKVIYKICTIDFLRFNRSFMHTMKDLQGKSFKLLNLLYENLKNISQKTPNLLTSIFNTKNR